MYKLITNEGNARRGVYQTAHGKVQTPVFMNVGTQAAIKGALSTEETDTHAASSSSTSFLPMSAFVSDLIFAKISGK